MKTLIVLLVAFLVARIILGRFDTLARTRLAGRIAMSVMLVFTAMGHFIFTKGMAMMLPEWVPYTHELVLLTGILELLAAIGLLVKRLQHWTGWCLILFFLCILPANIYAAIQHVDYQQATYDGHGTGYLWFRVPLQFLFITWTYWTAIWKGERLQFTT